MLVVCIELKAILQKSSQGRYNVVFHIERANLNKSILHTYAIRQAN